MLIRYAICVGVAASRLAELAHSRGNVERAGPSDEGTSSRRTYPLMILLHASVIAATAVRGGRLRPFWLVLFMAVQPVRLWVLLTLRERWNTRGVVSRGLDVETRGPYRFVRHPNYAVVAVELFALPLAFGLKRLAALAFFANAALLAIRVRDEERLLMRLAGYRAHFATRKRFIPGLF